MVDSLIEDYLHSARQDGSPGCDASEHPGLGKRALTGAHLGSTTRSGAVEVGTDRDLILEAGSHQPSLAQDTPSDVASNHERHDTRPFLRNRTTIVRRSNGSTVA